MKRFKSLRFVRRCFGGALLLLCVVLFGGLAHAKEKKEKQVICLVSGMQMDKKDMTEKYEHKGKTYSFCSKEAKDEFAKNPGKFLKKTFVCPIDGMKMKLTDAADAVEYKGKMIYFCMPGEKEKFLKSPEKYMKKKSEPSETKKPETKKMDGMDMDGMHKEMH